MGICTPGYECLVENCCKLVVFIIEKIGLLGVVILFALLLLALLLMLRTS